MAVAASLAIHVGVVGLALGRSSARESRLEPVVDMEMLPASAGPALEPPPVVDVPPPIEQPPVAALRSPLLLRRTRPAALAAGQRAPSASPVPAAGTTGSAALPRFNVSIPSVHEATPARFVLPSANTLVSTTSSATASLGGGPGAAEDTFTAREVAVPARLLASAPVVYPPSARAAEVEADVAVEILIDARGRVIEARSLATTGYGLDQEALRAVRSYRFSPAQRLGRAVRVRMRWNVLFRLR